MASQAHAHALYVCMEIQTYTHLEGSPTDFHPLTHTVLHIIYYSLPLQPTKYGTETHVEAWLFNYTTNQKGGECWTEHNMKHEHTEAMANVANWDCGEQMRKDKRETKGKAWRVSQRRCLKPH